VDQGHAAGTIPVPLTLSGDVANWPFDRYVSGPITVELFHGAGQAPERATVTFVDRLAGWKIDIPAADNTDARAPYQVNLQRSAGTDYDKPKEPAAPADDAPAPTT
jgi:hypothetical protein